jgi:hypothetical protein
MASSQPRRQRSSRAPTKANVLSTPALNSSFHLSFLFPARGCIHFMRTFIISHTACLRSNKRSFEYLLREQHSALSSRCCTSVNTAMIWSSSHSSHVVTYTTQHTVVDARKESRVAAGSVHRTPSTKTSFRAHCAYKNFVCRVK